jgi:hypothetical protein
MSYTDQKRTCRQCRSTFTFTADEQEFYASKGFANPPSRCHACRESHQDICWVCGNPVAASVEANVRCYECGWVICLNDQACLCPDYWDGTKGQRPECQRQIQRMGRITYDGYVAERQTTR